MLDLTAAFDEYHNVLRSFMRWRVNDSGDAEDLAAHVWLRLVEAMQKGTEIQNPRAYLFTTARNLVVDRRRRRKGYTFDSLDTTDAQYDEDEVIHRALCLDDPAELVIDCVDGQAVIDRVELPEAQARVLALLLAGYSYEEIAEYTGKSTGACKALRNRAISKLREAA